MKELYKTEDAKISVDENTDWINIEYNGFMMGMHPRDWVKMANHNTELRIRLDALDRAISGRGNSNADRVL